MYREIAPERLEKALRGKEATMAMSRGEIERKVYGKQNAAESLPGLELLAPRLHEPASPVALARAQGRSERRKRVAVQNF